MASLSYSCSSLFLPTSSILPLPLTHPSTPKPNLPENLKGGLSKEWFRVLKMCLGTYIASRDCKAHTGWILSCWSMALPNARAQRVRWQPWYSWGKILRIHCTNLVAGISLLAWRRLPVLSWQQIKVTEDSWWYSWGMWGNSHLSFLSLKGTFFSLQIKPYLICLERSWLSLNECWA